MTATAESTEHRSDRRAAGAQARQPAALWLSEVVVGGLVLLVALVAWVSLILADLRAHSLPAVAATTGGLVVLVAVVAVAATLVRRRRAARRGPDGDPRDESTAGAGRRRRRVRVDPGGLGMVAVLAVLTGFLFFPGFAYGAADKDPGGYVAIAMSIGRTGSYDLIDPASDKSRIAQVEGSSIGARFPGVWLSRGNVIVPQFYELWPALMATAYDAGGTSALVEVGPLCGLLAVCVLALAVRRALVMALGGGARAPSGPAGGEAGVGGSDGAGDRVGSATARPSGVALVWSWAGRADAALRRHAAATGLLAGTATGLLIGTNMLEVWQAKYPTSEITSQLFFVTAVFGVILALSVDSWIPALAAGVLGGVGFLDRADGMLSLLIAAAGGAALVAFRRFDRRAVAFTVGLAAVLPHALWQAYSPNANRSYTLGNGIPKLQTIAAAVVGMFVVGLVVRLLLGRWTASRPAPGRHHAVVDPAVRNRRAQGVLGVAIVVLMAGLTAVGALRPRLFGADYAYFSGQGMQRTFDEQSLDRLAWFVSWPAFVLALVGLAVIALRRWSAGLWVIFGTTIPLLAVYAWHTHNSVRLMWWARRYVPTALPGLLALVGIALGVGLAALLAGRVWTRVVIGLPALAALVGLLAFTVPQSLPLRHHDEMGGSFQITAELAALSGGKAGVYLWQRDPCCGGQADLFPAALWLGRGQLSALLPVRQTSWASYVEQFVRGFPDGPVFVVSTGADRPQAAGLQLVSARHFVGSLPFWEESVSERPNHAATIPINFTVWRVTSA